MSRHTKDSQILAALQVIMKIATLITLLTFLSPTFQAQTPIEDSDERYQDAITLFDEGKTSAAIYLLQQVEKDDPTNIKVLLKLGEMAISAKNWAYAIQVLRQASKVQEQDTETRLLLMDVYRAYQMPIQEIMLGREVINLDPENVTALEKLAFLYHDQDMPTEEIQTRERLLEVNSDDLENMTRLVQLYWKTGNIWEQVPVLREIIKRQPNRKDDWMRLAAAYGASGDRFNQLNTLDEAKAHGVNVGDMLGQAAKLHRKDLKIFPLFVGSGIFERDDASDVRTNRFTGEVASIFPRLRQDWDWGAWLRQSNLNYSGKDFLRSSRNVNVTDFQVRTSIWTNGTRNRFDLVGGVSKVWVGGTLAVKSNVVSPPTIDDFPFLEDRIYGGTAATGGGIFSHQLNNKLDLKFWVNHNLMEDIDALVRLVKRTQAGGGIIYTWQDQSQLQFQYEQWHISDNNNFRNARVELHRYLWGRDAIYDFRGRRVSFLRQPPAQSLSVRYRADWLDYSSASNLYQIYNNEVSNTLDIIGEAGLSRKWFIQLRGTAGIGNKVLKALYGTSFGVGYKDPDNENEITIQYNFIRDEVRQESQFNQALVGPSTFTGLQFALRWHF